MNRKNYRKNAPKVKMGYLTAKERKVVEWYAERRAEAKQQALGTPVSETN